MIERTAWLFCIAALAFCTPAHADERSDARAEYERGRTAHTRKDFAESARAFAHADELVPSAVSLRLAIDDASAAGDGAFALDLCDRAAQRADADRPLAASVEAARARFADLEAQRYAKPVDDAPAANPAPADPPAVVVALAPVPPPPAPLVHAPAHHGMSPTIFWIGVGLTGALAVGAIATEAVTASTHGSFQNDDCATQGTTARCADLASRGKTLQSVGAGLLIGTAAAGLTTAALGIFAVDFSRHARVAVAPAQGGGVAFATVSF